MAQGITVGIWILAFLMVAVALRLTTRIIAGVTPTLVRTISALVAAVIISGLLWLALNYFGYAADQRFLIGLLVVDLFVLSITFSLVLDDEKGHGVSFIEALSVLVAQVPVIAAVAIGALYLMVFTGQDVDPFLPQVVRDEPRLAAALAPIIKASQSRSQATSRQAKPPVPERLALTQAVVLQTRYGNVTFPAGTEVEVLAKTNDGYRARLAGNEVALKREQVLAR